MTTGGALEHSNEPATRPVEPRIYNVVVDRAERVGKADPDAILVVGR